MSYRSEIAIRLDLPKGIKSTNVINLIETETKKKIKNMFEKVIIDDIWNSIERITLYHSDIKWNDLEDSSINGFYKFLRFFRKIINENKKNIDSKEFYVEELNFNFVGAYHIIRIGESLDDIETESFGNV